MMTTPILDFVREYAKSDITRFHMPGHKGAGVIGCETLDITEISGADELFAPDGIIKESEKNASRLFGSLKTLYSTEGSTLAIKAMLAIAISDTPRKEKPLVLAARNAHKAFLYAAALLDFDIEWLYPDSFSHLCSCAITKGAVEKKLDSMHRKPTAVYITSPDYLGGMCDIMGISEACHAHGVRLLVDNAHGAYLAFLQDSHHPIALGADMCCDSAHKTLSVLTGGAYLHISKAVAHLADSAKDKMALFASTSPSYLTLCSLDACNAYLDTVYRERLTYAIECLDKIKLLAKGRGIPVLDCEPLKLVFQVAKCGYTRDSFRALLREAKIEAEFVDGDYAVLMVNEKNSDRDFSRLENLVATIPLLPAKTRIIPNASHPVRKMSVREAIFSPSERVSVENAVGRICASPTVSCPPAIPPIMSGELIDDSTASLFRHFGIDSVLVVQQ